jgi:hypothetical protein
MRIPDDKVNEWFPYVEESIRKDAANLVNYENGFILHQWHGIDAKIKGETKHDGEILSLTGWQRGQMLKKVLTRPFTLHIKRTWFDRVSTFLFVQATTQYLDDTPIVVSSRASTPPPPPTEEPPGMVGRLEV